MSSGCDYVTGASGGKKCSSKVSGNDSEASENTKSLLQPVYNPPYNRRGYLDLVHSASSAPYYLCNTLQDLAEEGNPHLLNVTISGDKLSQRSQLTQPSLSVTFSNDVRYNDEMLKYINNLSDSLGERFQLTSLSATTFNNLPIKVLRLNYGKVRNIAKGTFSELSDLTEVYIINNDLRSVTSGIFNYLIIEKLSLSNNKIRSLENNALYDMKNLKYLYLDKNFIENFVGGAIINHGSQLEVVHLQNNLIRTIDRNTFKGFSNLRILDISHNKIDKILSYSFEELLKLESLALANNFLRELNAEIFPNSDFSSLSKLSIDNNRLSYLTTSLVDKLSGIKFVSIGGNPWQCPCLDLLLTWIGNRNINNACDSEYFKGTRPICVVTSSKTCEYNTNVYGLHKYSEVINQIGATEKCIV
ncbi:hypothetical protein FQA39_LY12092 [Lamprigera yunnana]|nr:hypothetical protein FQA39_LY12092 [Lamprigera yunnana]